nr:MAG TPA: Hsc70-interacting protein [Caudoviricetes sp.]
MKNFVNLLKTLPKQRIECGFLIVKEAIRTVMGGMFPPFLLRPLIRKK